MDKCHRDFVVSIGWQVLEIIKKEGLKIVVEGK